MKLLLTSAGISNTSIRNALVGLLGKPISEASALFIPTAIYAYPGGAGIARSVINGSLGDPFLVNVALLFIGECLLYERLNFRTILRI